MRLLRTRHLIGFRPVWVALFVVLLPLLPAPAVADDPTPPLPPQAPLGLTGPAVNEGPIGADRPLARAALLFDHTAVEPGQDLRAGVWIGMADEWHIYWRNSGQSGYPTEVEWASNSAEFGALHWPTPEVKEEADGFIITYGYDTEVLFPTTMEVSEDASGSVSVEAVADFLICRVDCIPAVLRMRAELPVAGAAEPSPDAVELLDAAEASVPRSVDDHGWTMEFVLEKDVLRAGTSARGVIGLATCEGQPDDGGHCPVLDEVDEVELRGFIPDVHQALEMETTGSRAHPSAYEGRLFDLTLSAGPESPREERLSGLLFLMADGERLAVEVSADLPRVPADAEAQSRMHPFLTDLGEAIDAQDDGAGQERGDGATLPGTPPVPWWQALIFAFIGGLLLNLMPCVFPVLAIKVYGFTSLVHEGRAKVLAHGAAYTGGIVGSLLVLALVVVALRAGGTAVGWGFQFQEPLFIAVVGAILVIFAANLFGAFHIGVSASGLDQHVAGQQGMRRSVFEGVLAVILATPCSAPFLGTAVGFALAGSSLLILGIFAVLGLGLAAPYVALSLMPGWARFIPRPGPWMERFKQVLGFALIGTTVWLVWIIGQSAGTQGMTQLLIFLVACALAAWIYGACQRGSRRSRAVGAFASISLLALVGGATLQFSEAVPARVGDEAAPGQLAWETFDEQAIEERLAEGRPVFVDFTADWCITCKFNERTVIRTERVMEAVEEYDVAMFMADWTRRDDRIREVLARHGKAGVPMYLMYSPDAPDDPEVLPELLTADLLIRSFRSAAGAD